VTDRRVAVLLALALGLTPRPASAQWTDLRVPPRPAADSAAVAQGGVIYQARCASCHGEKGDGQGPVARYLWPRPRDLTAASYLLRSTASGELPTDEDLFRTITLGMQGTSMPAWEATLSVAQRWQVVFYIKTFAADLFDNPAFDPYQRLVSAARPAGAGRASLSAGRQAYEQAECAECHGALGRGDGGKGADLRDDRDMPSRPADMQLQWKYKGGRTVQDFYLRLTTGLDGTPMPSYAKTLTDEQRWALASYSLSLPDNSARERAATVLVARAATGPLPTTPDDPAWESAEEFAIPLTGQATFPPRWQIPSVTDLAVRALYNDGEVALYLAWDDPVPDTLGVDSALAAAEGWRAGDTYPVIFPDSGRTRIRFEDAAEVMIPARMGDDAALPHFVYGDPANPVDLWRWRAVRGGGVPAGAPLRWFRAAGGERPPEPRETGEPPLTPEARWQDGRWTVVIRRPLQEEASDAALALGRLVPIAFHVWDGSNGETGLRMALSSWYFLRLGAAVPTRAFLAVPLVILLVLVAEWSLVRWIRRRSAGGELAPYGIDPLPGAGPHHDWLSALPEERIPRP
jgi:mono/diheme cytochrome c family protein